MSVRSSWLSRSASDRGAVRPEEDEDDRERGDEEQAGSQDLAPVGVRELARAVSGDRGEVARDERQHAGGDERDEPGDEGDRNVGTGDRIVHGQDLGLVESRREAAAMLGRSA